MILPLGDELPMELLAALHHIGGERGIATDSTTNCFRLRFHSLFQPGRGFAFPCDLEGRVELDQLSEMERINYLYARAMVGRELACPQVECAEAAQGRAT
jgi:hypothetical protein